MTKLLEQAYAEISKLPEADQDAFAWRLLEELKSIQRSPTPVTNSLRGILRGSGVDEEDYQRHLEDEHL